VREVGGFYSEGDRVATALLPPHKMKAMDTTVPISGGRLHMRIDGTPGVPPLLFCNALGTTLHLWDGQAAAVVPFRAAILMAMVERSSPFFPLLPSCCSELNSEFLTFSSHSRIGRSLAFGETRLAFHTREDIMSVARVTEITSSSPNSFDEAMRAGLARANKTLENVSGAWIKNQEVVTKNGKITEYRVRMKVTFVLND
jgi:dodecin